MSLNRLSLRRRRRKGDALVLLGAGGAGCPTLKWDWLRDAAPPGKYEQNIYQTRHTLQAHRASREVTDVSNLPHGRHNPPVKPDGSPRIYTKFGSHPSSENQGGLERHTGASIKIKKMTRIYDGSTKFPKLEECAHFHYDFVDLGPVQVCINEDEQENIYKSSNLENNDHLFYLKVFSNEKTWNIRRTYENFRLLDKQLHRCIFDRKFSNLPELRRNEIKEDNILALKKLLKLYLNRFSGIAGNMINCGPVLSWLEMDNRGNHLIVTDESAINTPAVAAGHVVRRYNKQAPDEISFDVGDIISIIDMPPTEETHWWRGKRGFEVGFFPSDCVEIIRDTVPQAMASKIPETPQKPVLRKRGKLISFLRQFFSNRPTRSALKRTGIVKERVFGCDLGEHLLNSGHDVPLVLKCCTEVIETHGIVDGIYRLSGVASNIQKLRLEFDQEQVPDLTSEVYMQDIHSISSLLKMYFRELPNPLFTYQLYDKFAEAIADEEHRLMKVHDVVQQLPPPHYRTAENLIRHLARVAEHGRQTGMHFKNLAIVWAPNLLRSKELESSCNAAALQGVGVQAIVTEFLITYSDLIFSDKMPNFNAGSQPGSPKRSRPKSLAISTPTKLLSLEEARERALASGAASPRQKFIEVGGGPSSIPAKYHTIIDLPYKKKHSRKSVRPKSPVTSGWRSLFTRGRMQSWKMKQQQGNPAGPSVSSFRCVRGEHALTEEDIAARRKLRTVKSADSLLSVQLSQRGTSDALDSINPYAVSDVLQGRPSVTSTMSEIMPMEPRVPQTQRSLSYDYTGTDSEMDAELSSTEEGVFFGGRSCRSDSDARGYSKSLTEEVTEYMNTHPIILGMGSQSESCEEVSIASSLQESLPRSQHGEMVPIVTRSPSLGLYDEVYGHQTPLMHTFGRPVSAEPPSVDSDSDAEYHERRHAAQRSHSMGAHSYPSNLPRTRAPISPEHAGYLLETDIDSVLSSPGQEDSQNIRASSWAGGRGKQHTPEPAYPPEDRSLIDEGAIMETYFGKQTQSPEYANLPSSFFEDSPVKLLSPIGEILPLMQSPGGKRRFLSQSPEDSMEVHSSPNLLGDYSMSYKEEPAMELTPDTHETDESMPSGDELGDIKPSSAGYARMDISGESNEGSTDEALSPEHKDDSGICATLNVSPELQKSTEEFDADMGSIGSFSELSKSLNSLLNDVGSRGSYASADDDVKLRHSIHTPSELLIPETTAVTQGSLEGHAPESPQSDNQGGDSSEDSDVAAHYGTKPLTYKARSVISQSESRLQQSAPKENMTRSFQGQIPTSHVVQERVQDQPPVAMTRSCDSYSVTRPQNVLTRSLNPETLDSIVPRDGLAKYQGSLQASQSSIPDSMKSIEIEVNMAQSTVFPEPMLNPEEQMSRSQSIASDGSMSRSQDSDKFSGKNMPVSFEKELVAEGLLSRSSERQLTSENQMSRSFEKKQTPENSVTRSFEKKQSPENPMSRSVDKQLNPEGPMSRSFEKQLTPESPMSRSFEKQLTPEIPMSRSFEKQLSPESPMSRSFEKQLTYERPMSRSLEKQLTPESPMSRSFEKQLTPERPLSRTSDKQLTPLSPLSHSLEKSLTPESLMSRSSDEQETFNSPASPSYGKPVQPDYLGPRSPGQYSDNEGVKSPEDLLPRSFSKQGNDLMSQSLYLDDPRDLEYMTHSYDGNLSLSEDGYSDRGELVSDDAELSQLEESMEMPEALTEAILSASRERQHLAHPTRQQHQCGRSPGKELQTSYTQKAENGRYPVTNDKSLLDSCVNGSDRKTVRGPSDKLRTGFPDEMTQSLDECDLRNGVRSTSRSPFSSAPIDIPHSRTRSYSSGDPGSPSTAPETLEGRVECDGGEMSELRGDARRSLDHIDTSPDSKAPPAAKRKRSVKDLTCQFEVLTNSPPKEKDAQIKFKPVVFQKPKLVHLNTLSPENSSSGTFHQPDSDSDRCHDNQSHDLQAAPSPPDFAQSDRGSKLSQNGDQAPVQDVKSHSQDLSNNVNKDLTADRTKIVEIVEKSPPKVDEEKLPPKIDEAVALSPEEELKNVRKLSAMWERRKSSCSDSSDRSSAERMTRSLYEASPSPRNSKERSVSPRAPAEKSSAYSDTKAPPPASKPAEDVLATEPNQPLEAPKPSAKSKNSVRQLSRMFEQQSGDPPRKPVERTASDAQRSLPRPVVKQSKMWASMVE